MTSSPRLSDNALELINLRLRTTESTKTLLRQLACALVLTVAEEFDDAALVGCESVCIPLVSIHCLQSYPIWCGEGEGVKGG